MGHLRYMIRGLLAAIGVWLFSTDPALAECSRTIKLGVTDWHRGHMDFAIREKTNIDLELTARILKFAGCKVKQHPFPLKRLLKAIRHGEVDMASGASFTEERNEYARFSEPYRIEESAIFILKENMGSYKINRLQDIADNNLRVGKGMGVWLGKNWQKFLGSNPKFSANIFETDDHDILNEWLLHGRVNIIFYELYTGLSQFRRKGILDKVARLPLPFNEDDVHFIFSRATMLESDIDVLNKAIIAYVNSPEYTAVINRYAAKGN